MITLFFIILGLCFYGYVGYPLLLILLFPLFWVLERIRHWRHPATLKLSDHCKGVSILVAAYNEEDNIAKKIDSLLNQTFDDLPFEILVLNDGSSDGTADIVNAYEQPNIRLLDLPRGGKAAALNQGAQQAEYDILVFSDADNRWEITTLEHLIRPFNNLRVGAVSGQLVIDQQHNSLGLGDRIYRLYEAMIRRCESAAGSAVSADGGIFAIRKSLFQPVPADVTDDFFISTNAIQHGFSLHFAKQAIAYDEGVDKIESQYRRRIRVTVRGMRSLMLRKSLMNPFQYGFYSIQLISHKLIRRFTPFLALLLLPINALIVNQHWAYQIFFIL